MLKIKNNVDLKELEKFGFKQQIENGCCNGKRYSNVLWEKQIAFNYGEYVDFQIYESNRILILTVNYEEYFTESGLDFVFDLIQAGLVEKVVEE